MTYRHIADIPDDIWDCPEPRYPAVVTEPLVGEIDWDELARREPRIVALEQVVNTIRGDEGEYFCANETWSLVLKPLLLPLVGFDAERGDPALYSDTAWDVAVDHLYNLLPDCRRCGCYQP